MDVEKLSIKEIKKLLEDVQYQDWDTTTHKNVELLKAELSRREDAPKSLTDKQQKDFRNFVRAFGGKA